MNIRDLESLACAAVLGAIGAGHREGRQSPQSPIPRLHITSYITCNMVILRPIHIQLTGMKFTTLYDYIWDILTSGEKKHKQCAWSAALLMPPYITTSFFKDLTQIVLVVPPAIYRLKISWLSLRARSNVNSRLKVRAILSFHEFDSYR